MAIKPFILTKRNSLFINIDVTDIGTEAFEGCNKLCFVFNKSTLIPGDYAAGWYGNANVFYGYLGHRSDENYNYYYLDEFGFKKVVVLTLNNEILEDYSVLPNIIDGEYRKVPLE